MARPVPIPASSSTRMVASNTIVRLRIRMTDEPGHTPALPESLKREPSGGTYSGRLMARQRVLSVPVLSSELPWPFFSFPQLERFGNCAQSGRHTECVGYMSSTAAPLIWPARSRRMASFASRKGNGWTCVLTGTRGARARNSSPSRRVRLATERIVLSPHKRR